MRFISSDPFPFVVDNEPDVPMVHSLSGTRLRKTIRIPHHYLQQTIADSLVDVRHLPTERQKDDIMTQPVVTVAFLKVHRLLGMGFPCATSHVMSGCVCRSVEGETT